MVDVQIADDGARVETRLEDGARESTLTPLLAKEQGAVAGNEELSVSADVGDEGEEVMDHAAVMVDASAHVGGDEMTAIVTFAGRRIEGGEGAGGESAVALLTDAGDVVVALRNLHYRAGGSGTVGMDRAAVMVGTAAHVGGDEVTRMVTVAGSS